MKRLSMLLIPCIAISANAATFNVQGKIINSKDAKNPGIVKFEKDKTIAVKNNASKINGLAKTYNDDKVEKLYGLYDSDNDTYKLNGYKQTKQRYFELIDQKEKADKARLSYTGLNKMNNAAPYPSVSPKNCSISYKNPQKADFYGVPYGLTTAGLGGDGLQHQFNMTNQGHIGHRCIENYNGNFKDMCGDGISIYNVVGDKKLNISANSSNCQDNSFTRNYTLGIQHFYADRFYKLLSPNAHVADYVNEGDARINKKFAKHPNNPYEKGIHIGNIIASSTKNVSIYNEEAAELDDYIYHNRVIEFAPFTEKGQRTGAGIALNAISVLGVTSSWHDLLKSDYAANPRFSTVQGKSYSKPDIYSLSYVYDGEVLGNSLYDYEYNIYKNKQIIHNGYEVDFLALSDSWGASTTAAAMTADILSKYPFYKWHPEVVKALLITANDRSDDIYKSEFNDEGKYIDFQLIPNQHVPSLHQMLRGNRSRFFYGNNSDFFVNNKYSIVEKVTPGKQYNIAIAWLVRGDYALDENDLSSNYTMEIYNNKTNTLLATSSTDLATYRYIELDVPSDVTEISVRITRTQNKANDRIILGYNLHRIN